jgi:ATP-binding cassette subfamily C (CFTR/MRP) protein 1
MKIIPLAYANIFSVFTYAWVTPMMVKSCSAYSTSFKPAQLCHQNLGYQRTLQVSDLWAVDQSRSARTLSTRLDEALQKRVESAHEWNEGLKNGSVEPRKLRKALWCLYSLPGGRGFLERYSVHEAEWRENTGIKKPSLLWAMNDTFGRFFWSGGVLKVSEYHPRNTLK